MAVKQQPFKMNLQLFGNPFDNPEFAAKAAEFVNQIEGNQGQAAPQGQPQQAPVEPSNPQNNPQNSENSGQVQGQQPSEAPQGQAPQGQPSQQEQLLLGKFKSPEDLANGYVNVEKAFSQKSQEAAQAKQENEQLKSMIQQMQQQFANSNVTQQPQEQQQNPEVDNEEFMNKFYENPTQVLQSQINNAIQSAIQNAIMPQIAPIQQQYQAQQKQAAWNQAQQDFMSQVQDAAQFKPVMDQVMQSNPELYNHPGGPQAALSIAYQMAKGQSYQPPQAVLQNQDFVLQNLSPEAKQQIINEYLQQTKNTNNAPQIMGSQSSGNMMITPENKPKSIQEASDMALRMMMDQA